MKRLLTIFALLLTTAMFGQGAIGADAIYYGMLTTTERDALTVPADRAARIYNTTTGQWESNIGGAGWTAFAGGGGSGDVTGPASALDNYLPRFDGATGKIIQGGSLIYVEDDGDLKPDALGQDLGGLAVGERWGNLYVEGISNQFGINTNTLTLSAVEGVPYINIGESTGTPSLSAEGVLYADDTANRLKYHDGTSFKNVLLEGDASGGADNSLSEADQTISSGTRNIQVNSAATLNILSTSGGSTPLTFSGSNIQPRANNGMELGVDATQPDDAVRLGQLNATTGADEIGYNNGASGLAATTVQAAADEIVVDVAANEVTASAAQTTANDNAADITTILTVGSTLAGVNDYTSAHTLGSNDLLDTVLVRSNNAVITIPSGLPVGSILKAAAHPSNTTGRLQEGSGNSFEGYTDGIEFGAYPSGVTLVQTSTNSWEVFGDWGNPVSDYSAQTSILTNGTFDTDTDWTKRNGTTISGGVANIVGAGSIASTGNNHVLEQAPGTPFVNGNDYRVVIEWRVVSGSGNVYIGMDFLTWQTVSTASIGSTFQTDEYTDNTANANTNFTIGADSGVIIEVTTVYVYPQ